MKHLYKLLLLTFFVPLCSVAQVNYQPGYVVKMNGDTVHGFVDYKEWNKNPKQFNFRINVTANEKETYTTNNCNAFAINGFEYYMRFIVPISEDKVDVSNLSTGPDTSSRVDTVFLKIITAGQNITLYSYTDELKTRYFIAEKSALPVELIYRVYLDPAQPSIIIKQKKYQRQLQQLAYKYQPNNDKLLSQLNGIDYSEKDLQLMVDKINGTGNTTKIVSEKRGGSRFFAGVGANITSTQFQGDIEFAGEKVSSVFPDISVGEDFFLNKNVGDLIIRVQVDFTGSKVNYSAAEMGVVPYTSTIKFNQYTASLDPQLLYNFYNTKAFKIYLSAGLLVTYSSYSNKSYIETYEDGSTAAVGFPDVQSLYFGLDTKLGLVLNNKFNIYLGYSPSTAISDNVGYRLSVTQYKAGIYYLFGSK